MLNMKIVDLINEKLPPREAIELLEALVGARIQWHNINMLRQWEGNHRFDATRFDQKINELKAQKKSAKDFISSIKEQNVHIEFTARIEVRLEKSSVAQDFISELSNN